MHLLAAPATTLDAQEAAVDLGQTPADIVVLSFSDSDLTSLAAAWTADAARLPSLRLASLKQLKHPLSIDLYIDSVLAHARVVIVRSLGGLDYWRYGFERLAALAQERGLLLAALPGDDRPDRRLAELSTFNPEALAQLDEYFREGGASNAGQALRLAANTIGGRLALSPPVKMNAVVELQHANRAAQASAPLKSVALILFYRSSLLAADTAPIEALMAALAAQGLEPVALAVTSLKDPAAIPHIEHALEMYRPAIILNTTAFSALRDDDTTVLDAADAPVLQVVLAGTQKEAWANSARGLSSSDLAMNVVLPEIDGRLLTRAISFKAPAPIDPRLELAVQVHTPVPDRVEHVARLAAAWVALSRKPRAERRLAIMLSDYPARGGRAGYAVGLDTAASVDEIVQGLAEAGYTADRDAATTQKIVALLDAESSGSPQHLEMSLAAYHRHLARLPTALQDEIKSAWGAPEDDPCLIDGAFRFPCIRAGNLTILLQPDRGSVIDRKQGYHATGTPPRHGYVACYAALREIDRIDALIHLGTHGTLEWLPGKAMALSAECWPEAVLGPLPVIYPFIVNNPGEAMPAKRRLGAVTIGHMTPPLASAGLSGPLAELEALVEELAAAETSDPRRAGLIESEILDRAYRTGLAMDCGIEPSDAPRMAVAKLDAQLCDIKDLAVRDALHVFGRAQDDAARASLATTMLAANGLDVDSRIARAAIEACIDDCARAEREALISALDGRRIPPGPSGAPTRGRLDVLPTGRNMTTLDPRSIPTRTAAAIGARAADEVVRRFLQDHGDYPRSVFIDLWASASLRTGGDDIAQALALLGVRPVWDHASNRVTGVEVIPQAKLDRPRIDVTLRVSGLFRDIFESQISLVAAAVKLVASLDEDEDWNPIAAARRRGGSLARVFGGAPGAYGAGAADLALDGDWSRRGDLANAYLDASSQALDGGGDGRPARGEIAQRIASADALVHPQDDRERDLLDGDGVADFVGGFVAAAELAGAAPAVYHLDTSLPEAPVARALPQEIARVVRGRLANPRWLDGMLRHGYRGVGEIAQSVDALYAFAATTRAVPHHLIDLVHDTLIADANRHAQLRAANAAATEAIVQRLDDALERGLWVPRRNAVHGELGRVRAEAAE